MLVPRQPRVAPIGEKVKSLTVRALQPGKVVMLMEERSLRTGQTPE